MKSPVEIIMNVEEGDKHNKFTIPITHMTECNLQFYISHACVCVCTVPIHHFNCL